MQGEEAGPTTAEVGRGGSRGGRRGPTGRGRAPGSGASAGAGVGARAGSGASAGVGGERWGKREWGFGGKRRDEAGIVRILG